MAVKESKPATRKHKESKGKNGAGGKGAPLTDLQKILIANGGMAHQYLRTSKERFRFVSTPKRKGGRGAIKSMHKVAGDA